MRSRTRLALSAIALACCALLYEAGFRRRGVKALTCPTPRVRFERLTRGKWVPKPGRYDDDALDREWGTRWWACQRPYYSGWKTDELPMESKLELARRRMLRIASFDWHPELGTGPLGWNGTAFALAALNSEHGFILIGGPSDRSSHSLITADSLMKQAFDMLSIMMTVPDMHGQFDLFVESRTMRDGYPQEFWTTVALNQHSPHFPRFRAALPHVPDERFKRPLLSFARNELLLPWPELQGMLSEYGHRKWNPMAGWYLYNATYEEFLPSDPTPRWKGERNSVVLLNSGAHWNANRFNLTDQRIADAMFVDMVRRSSSPDLTSQADRVSRRLAARPKLDIIYRSMTVGHFNCWEAEAPARHALQLGSELNRPDPAKPWVRRRCLCTADRAGSDVRLDVVPLVRSSLVRCPRPRRAPSAHSARRASRLSERVRRHRSAHRRPRARREPDRLSSCASVLRRPR